MFRALAVAALACLPLPAAAQDMPLVDHVANMFLGLQEGYHAPTADVVVPIQHLGPGVFIVEGDRTVRTTITELEPCVFNYEIITGTRKPQAFQLHFKRLDSVVYNLRTTDANGMTQYILDVEAQPDFLMRDGKPMDARMAMRSVQTDVPLASLEASVVALKAACPTSDPLQDVKLVDHVASVLFGLHHGYNAPVAGRKIAIQRTSPGVYDIFDQSMHVDYTLSISEVGTCLFDVTEESRPLRPLKTRVDATKLTSVSYTPTTTSSGMTTYTIGVELEPGFRNILNPDGTTKAADDLSQSLETDAPLELLEGSVAALLAACP